LLCGLDLGSRSVKVALLDGGRIRDTRKFNTMEFYRKYGRKEDGLLVIDLPALGICGVDGVVSTGYGRNTIRVKGAETIPEIKAHVVGAVWQTGIQDFTLLDLGGQDSKVVKVEAGRVADFLTNDKCAASSGRYLENMAAVLGISLEELSRHGSDPVELSSTCAIFGESELIGRVVEGYSLPRLAAGVNYTIFRRIQPMLHRFPSPVIVFVGGVAHNEALRGIITRETGARVVIPEHPQFNGAIGCCLHGTKRNGDLAVPPGKPAETNCGGL